MYAVMCSPLFYKEIEKVIISKGEQILIKAIDTDIDVVIEFEKLGRISVRHLIIDTTAIEDTKKLIQAIRRYRIKNDSTQIIVIAPNTAPPSVLMDSLVKMGIYDILSPKSENLEDVTFDTSLIEVLENPLTYKKAVRWFLDNDIPGELENNIHKTVNNKNDREVIERTLTITKEKIVGTVIIAVTGTMQRIGTTHTTLSIAEFLKNNSFKVAVMEYHKSEHFNFIRNNYEDVKDQGEYFKLDNIFYYPYSEQLNVLDVLQQEYNYIILDMGKYQECDMTEFRRANERIIVSGVKDWELTDLELILRTGEKSTNIKNSYYFNFADKETFENIKENMIDDTLGQLKCYQAPMNPNPFTITKECVNLFKDLLKDILPEIKQANTNSSGIKKLFGFKKKSS